jgi:hypothetical protein
MQEVRAWKFRQKKLWSYLAKRIMVTLRPPTFESTRSAGLD